MREEKVTLREIFNLEELRYFYRCFIWERLYKKMEKYLKKLEEYLVKQL